ncbi:MAG TPA: NAD(P)H-hydrate dehydratase [Chthoniobacteraceae bacterium]|jgi:NAD(P)H-hydrate epimerase|nr:NAD(P)H-hydrate dehydratase [Chthoniobacteraceae bacterium]
MKLPIVSCAEMRRIEEATFAAGVTAERLMEEVGAHVALSLGQFPVHGGEAIVFYGKGNNGGDALVAARHLKIAGWNIVLRPLEEDRGKLSGLARKNLGALESTQSAVQFPLHKKRDRPLIIDGLLGIGAKGPLRPDVRALAREINALRAQRNALVLAVDIPTGLDAETGEADPDCVVADVTLTAGYAKKGLVADAAAQYVGRLGVIPLAAFEPHAGGDYLEETATPETLANVLPRRNFDSHKTQFGRVGIVAGSPGFTGAAILCASGALRAGAGLITLYAPGEIQEILAIKAPPEIMVRPVSSYIDVLDEKLDVLALGPGLGKEKAGAVLQLVEDFKGPMVLDADGLNIVAEHGAALLNRCAGPRLLTPHPGEMARLFPEGKEMSRYDAASQFTAKHPVTLLLKGSRTIIRERGLPASYNTTGTPAMGSGGMGDVLTGVCAALIGQHLSLYDAARLGAWVCGRAAELVTAARSEYGLTALEVAGRLPAAFGRLPMESV